MVNLAALGETKLLHSKALNNPKNPQNIWLQPSDELKVTSLNIRSLPLHVNDLKADPWMLQSDIIFLQETFCNENNVDTCSIPGYKLHIIPGGRGSGVAVYIKNHLVNKGQIKKFTEKNLQRISVNFPDMELALSGLYRASTRSIAEDQRTTFKGLPKWPSVFMGDFNFDSNQNPQHPIRKKLLKAGFVQLETGQTHLKGNSLDQVYLRGEKAINIQKHYPYYSDHQAISMIINISGKAMDTSDSPTEGQKTKASKEGNQERKASPKRKASEQDTQDTPPKQSKIQEKKASQSSAQPREASRSSRPPRSTRGNQNITSYRDNQGSIHYDLFLDDFDTLHIHMQ